MEQRRNDQDKLNQQQPRLKPPEMVVQNQNQNQQPPPPQKCPRCDSSNTKFCYYNNYSLSQPRYFCKACRRYWTHGGTLRNVPVGGGCRKSKRPKPSVPSPSASQPLPAALPSTALSSGQAMRPLPPIMSYGGGSFLSSLAAMQSLSAGINQGGAVNLGSGSGQYDANMALFQSLKPHQPPPQLQFQLQNDQYYRSEQNLSIPLRPPVSSWTQSFINRDPSSATATTTTSAPTSNFWSGATTGSSFNPDHWQDSNPGFDPSTQ